MKLLPWLVILSLTLVSCSGSKSAKKVNEETPQIEVTEADEFIENPAEEPAAVAETTGAVAVADATDTSETAEEPVVTDVEAEAPVEIAETPTETSSSPGTVMQYTVKKHETLMLIAFKLYGNYEKWKSLANRNTGKFKNGQALRAGMVLDYVSPAQEFTWNPQGLPYLIRTGDTLGLISKHVYTTPKKWKLIWENNKPLIKNPNKIFAGFTLYYLENGREVASGI
jgi:nucleoid-associated protein YgaU